MSLSTLHERLRAALGDMSIQDLGTVTKTHPETVRRYLRGSTPSAQFISALCHERGFSAKWLLTGAGPMYYAAPPAGSDPDSRLAPLLTAVEKLLGRIHQLELAVERNSDAAAGAPANTVGPPQP